MGTASVREDTGGGWTGEVARLEGGAVLVLTDSLGGVDYFERCYFAAPGRADRPLVGLAAALYRSGGAWLDSGDEAVSNDDTLQPNDEQGVRRVVEAALAGAFGVLR